MTQEPELVDRPLTPEQVSGMDDNQKARVMMVQMDPILRSVPYEQRTAILLNLLVTYAAEEPAATQARGKFINAMCEEFRKRLQMYLPLAG
jgi:hypothetical protein